MKELFCFIAQSLYNHIPTHRDRKHPENKDTIANPSLLHVVLLLPSMSLYAYVVLNI